LYDRYRKIKILANKAFRPYTIYGWNDTDIGQENWINFSQSIFSISTLTTPQFPPRRATRLPVKPFKQIDDSSCGLRAMQALYSYYGLNSRLGPMGARLGTSFSTPVFIPGRQMLERRFQKWGWDFKGTWPWDIFLVLAQDGFQVQPLKGRCNLDALPVLNREIKKRYPVLLLTLYPENHYTLLCGVTRKGAWIACSLGPQFYFSPWSTFERQVTGMVAIRPTKKVNRGAKGVFSGRVDSGNPTNPLLALTSATTWIGKLGYQYLRTDKNLEVDDWDDEDDWEDT